MIQQLTLDEIRGLAFSSEEVLTTLHERQQRDHKLISAMALTNVQHEPVWLRIKLANGDVAEIYSNLVDLEDDYVELHGGIGIPVRAIFDVGV